MSLRCPERPLAGLGPGVSEPQPTTVSHDGGCVDGPCSHMSRCTPTGLSHAAMPSTRGKPHRRKRGGETFGEDLFVPKQLGCELGLEPVGFGPALMVRRRSWVSAVVRLRCHSVRHSPAQRSIADRCVVSGCAYGLKRAVGFRGFQL